METEAGTVIFASHGDRRTNVAGAKLRRTTIVGVYSAASTFIRFILGVYSAAATFVWFLMGRHQAGYFRSIGTTIQPPNFA
jgi:hypothetical protein